MSGLESGRKSATGSNRMHAENESVRMSRAKKNRQRALGEQLKRVYQEVVDDGVPDEFMRLLEEADRKSQAEGSDH